MKDREAVTCNGRAAFYACMWDDLRQAAMDCGWALGLHGSLNSDMDIMAMPWTDHAVYTDKMLDNLQKCFDGEPRDIFMNFGPNGRTIYTIPIFGDFYLDINVIDN